MFNPVEHPLCLESPHCVSEVSSWHHYISFALLVVALLRPRALDEGGALVFTIPMILGRLTVAASDCHLATMAQRTATIRK
jgi:hypothetical protein